MCLLLLLYKYLCRLHSCRVAELAWFMRFRVRPLYALLVWGTASLPASSPYLAIFVARPTAWLSMFSRLYFIFPLLYMCIFCNFPAIHFNFMHFVGLLVFFSNYFMASIAWTSVCVACIGLLWQLVYSVGIWLIHNCNTAHIYHTLPHAGVLKGSTNKLPALTPTPTQQASHCAAPHFTVTITHLFFVSSGPFLRHTLCFVSSPLHFLFSLHIFYTLNKVYLVCYDHILLSVYTRTNPLVLETSTWKFAHMLFSVRSCSFVGFDIVPL